MDKIDRLCWTDYFMNLAVLASHRSADPATKVGAAIVGKDKKIISLGYNGFPTLNNGKNNDEEFPWNKGEKNPLNNKYLYVIHAEVSAILNSNQKDLIGCVLYTTLHPCNDCAKIIVQSGIRQVYYLEDKYHDEPFCVAARKIFDVADVIYQQHIPFKRIKLE